jgi:hypothetical protein
MTPEASAKTTNPVTLILAWVAVGIPLLIGVLQTVTKAAALFR